MLATEVIGSSRRPLIAAVFPALFACGKSDVAFFSPWPHVQIAMMGAYAILSVCSI